jgi:hypothetical protein
MVRFLAAIGKSVSEALELGWLHPKFKAEAIGLEAEISPPGVAGTVKRQTDGSKTNLRQRSQQQPSLTTPAILETPVLLC